MTRNTISSLANAAQGPAGGRSLAVRVATLALAMSLAACQAPGIAARNASQPPPATPPASPVGQPVLLSSASLIGMSRERVSEVFGEPSQVRHESPAEVWQYASANCVIDIYLYQVTGGGLSVSFVEARDAAAMAMEPDPCFQLLIQRAAL